jgi:alcohol dehydrogenase (cytochrome c)
MRNRPLRGQILKAGFAFCLLLGAAGAGLVQAQGRADTPTNPFANDPAAIAAGRQVFEGTCAACHGPGASGGRAPALNTGRFARGGEDYEIFHTIQTGVPGTEMPSFNAIPANDIWKVVTYLRSLSGQPAAAASTPSVTVTAEQAQRGETIFFGKGQCSTCHEVNGRGLHLAADLSGIGASPLATIREGTLHKGPPPRRAGAVGRKVEATLADGRRVTGLVRNEDSFNLHVLQADGQLLMLDRKDLRGVTVLPGAFAPNDIETRLSAAEVTDVVAYLSRQKERDVKGAIAPSSNVLAPERIVNSAAEPHNWPTYWGDYKGHHFSELKQVTSANVGALQAKWAAQLPGPSLLQATPIVVDGIMYVAGPPGDVYAFDAKTGLQIWKFTRKQDIINPYQINPTNRGVAVLGGRVFMGTLDDNLIALDARTGRQLWERRIADTMLGYTMTGAPLALPDKIIVGVGAGEYGIRGFLEAYDPATGKRLWRFETIPGPGEPGNETWPGDTWKSGGGGTWLTGSYDKELDTLYWTVGNPAPSFNADIRKGDNLYSNTVLALNPNTGKLKWHYQFTPNDSHDWDSVQDMVLADRMVGGKMRKVLIHADRNGFLYMLDRTNGQFLGANPFVRQSWNDGFDKKGRPKIRPESVATPEGVPVFPAVGGTNFQAPSYDKESGVLYLAFLDAEGFAGYGPAENEKGRLYTAPRRSAAPPASVTPIQGVRALDPDTGKALWTYHLTRNSLAAGVLATRGGVLFAASAEGSFIALDVKDGAPLWRFKTGGVMSASPMSYAVDGVQYVAIAAGNTVYSFALPSAVETK